MASITDLSAPNPALLRQAEILSRPLTETRRMADAIRALAIDAVEAANSGHPGLPMGMADVATVLFSRFLKFDASEPRWPDRDRFVLSGGHGSMLLYALLHLTGYQGMDIGQIKNFRQLHSKAAGHPEYGEHPGIETTTGPLGQGLATAVGMALAEQMLAAQFGKDLVDHRTWVFCGDGDLMEGISHEAISLAGHLQLSKLCVLWDDNSISIDGDVGLSCSDDQLKRFAASGWATRRVDGHDPEAVATAIKFALKSKRPTLIACQTIIGFGAPTKAGTAAAHGAALGATEAASAKQALGWNHAPFEIPEGLAESWRKVGARGAPARKSWTRRLAKHPARGEFQRVTEGALPAGLNDAVLAAKQKLGETRPKIATRQASQKALEVLIPAVPELAGGSADLTGSNLTLVKGMKAVSPTDFAGRYIYYGIREHGMAAAMNGIALHGGLIPYGGTFFVFTDYMRPALRLAALMGTRAIHVLTHDSIGLGEDGPTHQPVEHLASLRAMPNMMVFRPADAIETLECWQLALERKDGPSLLVLSRQATPCLSEAATSNLCAGGGYVLLEAEGERDVTLIATGTEVAIAAATRDLLAQEGIRAAVVSLPCWELFAQTSKAEREAVLGSALRVGIEAAGGFGWERWLGADGIFVGLDGFGASAPAEVLYRHFGITPGAIAAKVRDLLALT
jgi:transketolase